MCGVLANVAFTVPKPAGWETVVRDVEVELLSVLMVIAFTFYSIASSLPIYADARCREEEAHVDHIVTDRRRYFNAREKLVKELILEGCRMGGSCLLLWWACNEE